MVEKRLPQTEARLSISTFFEVELLNDDGTSAGKTKLGSIENVKENNPRPTNPRYQADDDNPGDIIERIPNLVDRTLVITKAVLNIRDMIQSFGSADMNDIIDMRKPFNIIKKEKYPENVGGPATKVTKYLGCWMHDNPKEYNIAGGSLKMIQNATIGYTRKEVTTVDLDKGAEEVIG